MRRFIGSASFAIALALAVGPSIPSAQASEARLSLITIRPGKELYSAFGHTAIRVVDDRGDRMYNFGLSAHAFDLKFALNMLRGNMEFMIAALDSDDTVAFYRDVERRGIVEQPLNLDSARARSLIQALDTATRGRNRFYNYRYFADNCVTRPAEMLRTLVGDASPPFALESGKTLRSSVSGALAKRAWLRFVTDVLCGPLTDRPMPDGPIFLPEDLVEWAARTTVPSAGGKAALAGPVETIFEARPYEDPPLTVPPLAVFALLLAAALAFTFLPGLRGKGARVFDTALFIAILLPASAILMFWLPAHYEEASWNLNLLWAGALPLLAAALDRRGAGTPASKWLFRIAAACALVAALGGGLSLQRVGLEERLIAAAVMLRCAARGRIKLPRARSSAA
jgi:hypothetical protein